MDAKLPPNEAERIKTLQNYQVLDTPAEKDFDDIVFLASKICETPIALVSLIDTNRQWFKSKIGLDVCETHRDYAFCAHAIFKDELLVVPDATMDERFKNNPLVTEEPKIRFYAGAPLITPAGQRIGTLCVIDRQPRQLNEFQLSTLEILAKQVVKELELRLQNNLLRKKMEMIQQQKAAIQEILEERNELIKELTESNIVRDRVLSIMAHDLRSPLTTIQLLLSFLGSNNNTTGKLEQQQHNIRELSQAVDSTTQLLDNLLEWSMNRMKGKQKFESIELKNLFEEIVETVEPQSKQKKNKVKILVDGPLIIKVDPSSLGLILRNLLTNANKFTDEGEIQLKGFSDGTNICIIISDTGIGMDQEQLTALFSWNKRTTRRGTANEKGSGLGLPMCADMLKKMGGSIEASSAEGKGTQLSIVLPKSTGRPDVITADVKNSASKQHNSPEN